MALGNKICKDDYDSLQDGLDAEPKPSATSAGYTLKPCPFCGGKAEFDYDDNGWNWIECQQCHVSSKAGVHAMEDCRPMLAEGWNKRV